MAGPEPYPQVKWTRVQDDAYAEGRASAQAAAQGQPSRSGNRRRRVVRTAAGAKRYKVPIGAEIGSARTAKAAESQKDTESRGRYEDFVGADSKAQAAAMRGLNDNQLQRLSQVAYSFKSSNPDVVRLRIGVANELKRRGFNVNDFGGLGKGSAQPAGPAPKKGKPAPAKKRGKKVAASKPAPKKPVKSAMQARQKDRRLLEMSTPQLRQALKAFSRVPADKRQVVARFLVRRAVELSATSLLGASVVEAAHIQGAEAIELAGRWKHGWIPLDATAVRAKMKGGNGKPWWEGGKQKRRSGGTMRTSIEAGRKARANREARRTGAPAKRLVAVPKSGGTNTRGRKSGGPVLSNKQTQDQYRPSIVGKENRPEMQESKATLPDRLARGRAALDKETDKQVADIRAKRAAAGVSKERTSVVKSSPKPERGSKVNQLDREIAELEAQKGKNLADHAHLRNLKARRAGGSSDAAIAMGGSKAGQTAMNMTKSEPFPAAANYLTMHGTAKTREKLDALKQKRDNLKAMRRKTTSVDLEIKGLENVLARGSSGKA